jgi:tungstate transport system permease protein
VEFLWEGVQEAGRLLLAGDRATWHAVLVSVLCTTTAIVAAAFLAVPYGAWLATGRRRLGGAQVFLLRWGMFVPTVVVGLLVYGLLSRRGPLGPMDLLYSKEAIVIGEALLAFPVLAALTHGAVSALDPVAIETARTLGASPTRALFTALGEVRVGVSAAFLAAFARCFSELGVAVTVGGNLELRTRTLASTVVLDLSRGRFGKALAPGLLLLLVALAVALLARWVEREKRR